MAFTKGVGPGNATNPAGNAAVTLTGCTAGRTVIIGIMCETATISAPTCPGETCNLRGAVVSAQGFSMQMADCVLAGSGNKTFTAALSGTPSSHIWAIEIVESCTYDNSTNNNSAGAANASVNVATGAANCLLLGHLLNKGGTGTPGAGYTDMSITDFVYNDDAEYSLDAGAQGTKAINFTHASGAYTIQGYSWKPSAAAAVPQGWQNNANDIVPRPPIKFAAPPAIALTPSTLPPQIGGMAWFEPPDSSSIVVPKTRRNFPAEPPQLSANTPLVTWSFLVGDTVWLRDPPIDCPPAFGQSITQPVSVSGIAWFEPPDRDRKPTKINGEAPPAISLTPATLPPQVSGMSWFEPPDRDRPAIKIRIESSPAAVLNAATLPVGISGMSWFEPPDRDKKVTKVNVESPPAIALISATLPPRIAGMSWFVPAQVLVPRFGINTVWLSAPAMPAQAISQVPPSGSASYGVRISLGIGIGL